MTSSYVTKECLSTSLLCILQGHQHDSFDADWFLGLTQNGHIQFLALGFTTAALGWCSTMLWVPVCMALVILDAGFWWLHEHGKFHKQVTASLTNMQHSQKYCRIRRWTICSFQFIHQETVVPSGGVRLSMEKGLRCPIWLNFGWTLSVWTSS